MEVNRTTDNCYGVVPMAPISCRSARVDMLELWHHRFGHANFKQVSKVSKLEAVKGLPKFGKVKKTICGACQMGKQTKVSHHKVNVIATSRCLELLQEMARVMLLNKQIPQKFWEEAMNTSCHIGNRIFFQMETKKTVYEIWNGKKPRVSTSECLEASATF